MTPSKKTDKIENLKVLVDGREFFAGKLTGIARFLENLLFYLSSSRPDISLVVACEGNDALPPRLKDRKNISTIHLGGGYLTSERILSKKSAQGVNLFISPYPKLPLFGTHCPTIHTVHDVLYLTLPQYRKVFRRAFDLYRLKTAIRQADLTWFCSDASCAETQRLVKKIGHQASVRYPGIAEAFCLDNTPDGDKFLERHDLRPGYILCLGNGQPHKNIGVLLKLRDRLDRRLVFVGVSLEKQRYWSQSHDTGDVLWLEHVRDSHLAVLIKNAFCLAQPSIAEGFGYPPLEAMACGIPAIVSDIPVLVETTGGCALRADPHSPDSWRQAFQALENTDMRRTLVAKGLKWVAPLRGAAGWKRHIADITKLAEG